MGAQGSAGATGAQGAQGRQGSQGRQGATGPSTAINATNTTTSSTLYPVMVLTSGSNQTPYVTTGKLTYVASTGLLSTTDFSATSDARLKDISGRIQNSLAILQGAQGVRYQWNELAKSIGLEDDSSHIGVIAQEIQKVLPEVVHDIDGYLRVSYDRLVPVLIEAIKELDARLTALESK